MRLMTWNINSLRIRLGHLEEIIKQKSPDIICLQETKVNNPLFPENKLKALGYHHMFYKGMKSYNGVAILSRIPFQSSEILQWCDRDDCRHVCVTVPAKDGDISIHNFYVPAGGDIPDIDENEKFLHKMTFLKETKKYFKKHPPQRSILVGDLNIAPYENDVWSHRQLLKIVSHTPQETKGLLAWQKEGFIDAMRQYIPEPEKVFTWWSYRNKDWHKSNRGRRLDHIWLTKDLLNDMTHIDIFTDPRDWERPSDHVPVFIDLDV